MQVANPSRGMGMFDMPKVDEHAVAQREAECAEFGPCKHIDEILVRMHPSLKKAVVEMAKSDGISVNVLGRRLLFDEYRRRRKAERKVESGDG